MTTQPDGMDHPQEGTQKGQRRRAYVGSSGRELSDSAKKRLSLQSLSSIRVCGDGFGLSVGMMC